MEKLRGEKPKAEFLPGPTAARQGVQLGKTFECESRNKIEEEIMTTLRGGDVNMIGICGMGGLGKTTMAKKIMNRVLNEHIFEEVVIATVSQNVDITKIQDEIGGQLRLDKLKEERSQSARTQILHSRLSATKRILLVLDDVWERLVLEDFGIPHDSKGCTILSTSRNSDVLRAMEVQIFGMKVLSEEEAWSFFREGAGTCVDDRDLNPIAEEVAKECGGLPIALAAVGAGLKHQRNAAIWKNTLRELKQRVPDTVRMEKEVYNPLKWSYSRLNSKPAQFLFLLCCLFPEDADIPLNYLTYFGMGLGIFEGITSMEDARNKRCALTEFLKDRSLLLESKKEDCVRMHDVVRDVCTLIAKEEGYIGKDGCTWISSSHLVGERNVLLSGSRCPNLRLLFLNSGYDSSGFKFNDAFLEGMKELHVLYIERYSLTTLPHLAQSLGKLHTLILDSCDGLETISGVGELVNLEILVCRHCNSIRKLPFEMKGLGRLKLLELTWCRMLQSIGRGIISSLDGLEELKMHGSFNTWETEDRGEGGNASMKELEALPNLACLEIDISDPSILMENMPLLSKKIVRFIILSDGYSHCPSKFSKAMSLHLERETRLGDWIKKQFMRDTECLYLGGYGGNNLNLANSQNIRWLEMSECEGMKNVVRTSGGSDDATVFPSLEHLKLEFLPELQEICDGPIASTSFQNLNELKLRYLSALTQIWKSSSVWENNNNVPHFSNLSSISIHKCDRLRNLGQLSMAGKDCLPQLEYLDICDCEMMEQVFLWNGEEVITKVFPKLKDVRFYILPNLTTFYQGIQGIQFPLLRKMKIQKCPKIKGIIESSSADIDEYGSLHLFSQPQKVSFSSLEALTITKYEGSRSLFMFSMAANLVSLRKLSISTCAEMIKVIEGLPNLEKQERILAFPKLEKLELFYLPKLVSFCDSKCEVELPLLRKVMIRSCPSMKNFSLGLPNLEAFETDLTTYVRVGVDVSFNNLKELLINGNENPWYDDKMSVSLFNGLNKLIFYKLKGSMSLFSSSTVGNLVNLRVLEITYSDGMLVHVIEEEEDEEDGKVVSGGEIRTYLFPKLEELRLYELPNLVSFSERKCDVEFTSLTKVEIDECPNMESFSMGFVAAPNLKTVQIDEEEIDATKDLNGALQQLYLARREEVLFSVVIDYNPFSGHKIHPSIFKRLSELTIEYEGSRMSIFTLSVAANLVGLTELRVTNCDEIIKVIEDEQHQERIVVFPVLKGLKLRDLPKLVSFCDSKCEVELPLLRKVEIQKCQNMIKFNLGLLVATPNLEVFTTNLTTYVGVGIGDEVAFNSLKRLEITENENPLNDDRIFVSLFNGLEELEFYKYKGSMSLLSASAVGKLVNLRVLNIRYCYEMVKVIEDEEEEDDEKVVVSGGEIITSTVIFPKLEELYLCFLPKLVRFCEWRRDVELPSLTKVEIDKCFNMESFSMGFVAAPCLKNVKMDEQEIDATKDLNGLLHQHYFARLEKEKDWCIM